MNVRMVILEHDMNRLNVFWNWLNYEFDLIPETAKLVCWNYGSDWRLNLGKSGNQLHTGLRLRLRVETSQSRLETTTAQAETMVASPVATRNRTMISRNHHFDSQPPVATRNQLLWLVIPVATRDRRLRLETSCSYTVLGLPCHGPNSIDC